MLLTDVWGSKIISTISLELINIILISILTSVKNAIVIDVSEYSAVPFNELCQASIIYNYITMKRIICI